MEYEVLTEHLPDLKADLRKLEAQKSEIDAQVAHLQRIIEGIEGLRGPQAAPSPQLPGVNANTGTMPDLRGIAAVRAVMQENPRIWNAREVHRALERRGWVSAKAKHPVHGTEAAINRLYRYGEIEKIDRGQYRWKEKEVPTEAGTP